jgi:hypothetical protein
VRVTTGEQTTSFWRAGLGTNGSGYSIPRVSLDYSWESGLTALSLDLPLLSHDDGSFGSVSLGPYVDIGLGGSAGDADQTMSEFGGTFGVQLF